MAFLKEERHVSLVVSSASPRRQLFFLQRCLYVLLLRADKQDADFLLFYFSVMPSFSLPLTDTAPACRVLAPNGGGTGGGGGGDPPRGGTEGPRRHAREEEGARWEFFFLPPPH